MWGTAEGGILWSLDLSYLHEVVGTLPDLELPDHLPGDGGEDHGRLSLLGRFDALGQAGITQHRWQLSRR